MRSVILTIIAALSFYASGSQAQPHYSGSIEAGVLNGNWQTNGYIQTTHGVQYKQWFAGIGTGVDYYRYRTVPVYAEVHRSFGKHNAQPFIVVAAGINATWPDQQQKQEISGWMQTTPAVFHNGFYTRAGIGMMFNTSKKLRFAVNAAYSYKTLSRSYSEWLFDPWPQPVNTTVKTMVYHFNRLAIGLNVFF